MSYPPPPCCTVPTSPCPCLGDNCYSLYMEREQSCVCGVGLIAVSNPPPPPPHTHTTRTKEGEREGSWHWIINPSSKHHGVALPCRLGRQGFGFLSKMYRLLIEVKLKEEDEERGEKGWGGGRIRTFQLLVK